MTKKQMREHKAGNAFRRDAIIRASKGRKKGENASVYLGGVGQRGNWGKEPKD